MILNSLYFSSLCYVILITFCVIVRFVSYDRTSLGRFRNRVTILLKSSIKLGRLAIHCSILRNISITELYKQVSNRWKKLTVLTGVDCPWNLTCRSRARCLRSHRRFDGMIPMASESVLSSLLVNKPLYFTSYQTCYSTANTDVLFWTILKLIPIFFTELQQRSGTMPDGNYSVV